MSKLHATHFGPAPRTQLERSARTVAAYLHELRSEAGWSGPLRREREVSPRFARRPAPAAGESAVRTS